MIEQTLSRGIKKSYSRHTDDEPAFWWNCETGALGCGNLPNRRTTEDYAAVLLEAGFTGLYLTQCKDCRRCEVSASGDALQAAKLLAYEFGNESAMLAIKDIRKERKRHNWLRRHNG